MATKGHHEFFAAEANEIKDVRVSPIKAGGYSIRLRIGPDGKLHTHVRLTEKTYREMKARFLDLAVHRSAENLVSEFWTVPFEPYVPVRRQLMNILRAVNAKRKAAGYKRIPFAVIPMRRKIVNPFEDRTGLGIKAAKGHSRIDRAIWGKPSGSNTARRNC